MPLRSWLLLAVLIVAACSPPSEKSRPHVLVITVDTLRPDYLSTNGYDLPTTPFLDAFLSDGVTFDRAVTPIPRTTQALASLLTGTYPHTHRVRTLYDNLAEEVPTIAELARNVGYRTVAVVSNHVLVPERGLNRGFDIYDNADDAREAQETTRAAMGHLSRIDPAERIFAWVHYIDPHVPYYPPETIAREFSGDYHGPYRLHFGDIKGGTGKSAYPGDLGKVRAVYLNRLSDEVNAHIRRLYAADIRSADDAIDDLVTELHARFGREWLIVFTADHGESLGEHDYYYDHGDYVYNAEIRVPLAFSFPEGHAYRKRRVVHDWVSLVDVAPTIIELLDLGIEGSPVEGRSLLPHIDGRGDSPQPVFAESGMSFFPGAVRRRVRFDITGRFRTVIDGDWKLIWTPGQTGLNEFELYDLARDQGETKNLFRAGHPMAMRLAELLSDWTRATPGSVPTPSEEDLERLRSLGYVE